MGAVIICLTSEKRLIAMSARSMCKWSRGGFEITSKNKAVPSAIGLCV